MKTYSLSTLVNIARTKTSYFKELYRDVPEKNIVLEELPPIDLDSYWLHDPIQNENYIFTDKLRDGFIYTSSGSTSIPRYTTFSKQEWLTFSQVMGQLMWKTKLIEDGDVIANLASIGDLLSSFLTVHDGLFASLADCIELPLPISRTTSTKKIVSFFQHLNVNVLICLTFNLLDIAYYIKKNKVNGLKINKIIYGGETLHKFQLKLIQEAFPNALITPCIYSSNDAGLIGYWDESCDYNQLKSCEPYAKIELIDENTKETIREPFKEGIVLATNFTKLLMPTIRYPVGDKGMWVDEEDINRRITITGRLKNTKALIKDVSLTPENFINLLNRLPEEFSICRFQLEIYSKGIKDELLLMLGYFNKRPFSDGDRKLVENELYTEIPKLLNLVNEKLIEPIQIEFVELDTIKANVGPGKHRQIIDRRTSQKHPTRG